MFNRLLFVTTVVTCLATLVGFLARSWWFFELFSHFRVQYLIILAVCGLVYVIRRRRLEAILAIGVALGERIEPIHQAQLLTYLKLSGLSLGLLLNFNVPVMKGGIVRVANELKT